MNDTIGILGLGLIGSAIAARLNLRRPGITPGGRGKRKGFSYGYTLEREKPLA